MQLLSHAAMMGYDEHGMCSDVATGAVRRIELLDFVYTTIVF